MRKLRTAILFDADGVVVRSKPFTFALESEYGIPEAEFAGFFKERLPACIVGKADLAQELSSYLPTTGWRESVDAFLAFWFEAENKPDRELLREIAALRAAGYFVGLGTNQERHRVAFMRREMGFGGHFDEIFASCSVGHKKPSGEYFTEVSRRLAAEGVERVVFFDDREDNAQAGRAAGWEAHVYKRVGDVEEWRRGEDGFCADGRGRRKRSPYRRRVWWRGGAG